MKNPHRFRKQNKGFSLVEVLVTLALISVLSVPLIRTFLNSSKLNYKARKIQNATDVAQTIAEQFKALPLDTLKTQHGYTVFDNGTIIFKNVGDGINEKNNIPYYKGNDGDKLYVSVVLSPTTYTDGSLSSSEVSEINNYLKPQLNNLSENSSVTCIKEITKYDTNIKNAFKDQYNIVVSQTSAITKTSTIRIVENQSGVKNNKTEYRYYLDIKYEYSGKTIEYSGIKLGIGVVDAATTKAPNLYIVYTPFLGKDGYNLNANDNINIEYMLDATSGAFEKPVNIYLVEQQATTVNGNKLSLDKSKIRVSAYSKSLNTGEFNNSACSNLNFYTNVSGWNSKYTLTTGDKNMITMYTMDIYVWKDKADGLSIGSDNQSYSVSDDYYANVTDVMTKRKAEATGV